MRVAAGALRIGPQRTGPEAQAAYPCYIGPALCATRLVVHGQKARIGGPHQRVVQAATPAVANVRATGALGLDALLAGSEQPPDGAASRWPRV